MSLAQAILEYTNNKIGCKTLFSTHYHELTELEGILDGVKNYKLTVREYKNTIIFLSPSRPDGEIFLITHKYIQKTLTFVFIY